MAIANQYFTELDQLGRKASTIASAIEINRPVNLRKCLRALDEMNGVVRQVSDQEMLDAKAKIAAGGFGCEPASAASVAGARLLVRSGRHRAPTSASSASSPAISSKTRPPPSLITRPTRSNSTKSSAAAASAAPASPTAPSPCRMIWAKS